MKKLTALILAASMPCLAMAGNRVMLENYTSLENALKTGHHVRAVVNFDDCKVIDSKTNGSKKEWDSKGDFIGMEMGTFSNTHWTSDGKTKNGVVASMTEVAKFENYNFRSYTLKAFTDNTSEFVFTIADAKTKDLIETYTFSCKMSDSKSSGGTSFYAID